MASLDLAFIVDQASDWATIIAAFISMFSLWLAIWISHDAKRPQIVASLERDGDKNAIYLVVQNSGNGVARNVSFSDYDETIFASDLRSKVLTSFVKNGIPILIPGASRSTVVADGEAAAREMEGKASGLTVTYYEKGILRTRKKVTESFVLEYISFSGALYTKSDASLIRKALEKIAEAL